MLKHSHSGLRWIVLLLLIFAIYKAYSGWKSAANYTDKDRKLFLFTMIFTHIQILLGLILYFISPYVKFESGVMKDSLLRFYTVEHILMMLIVAFLITRGFSKAKRLDASIPKFKAVFWHYFISLIIILLAIPWPFRGLGAGWF